MHLLSWTPQGVLGHEEAVMASDAQLRKQLRYVRGQLDGVLRMVDGERPQADVTIQLKAISAGVARALALVAEDAARADLRADLERQLNECPGACDYCDEILAIFDALDLKPLLRSAAS